MRAGNSIRALLFVIGRTSIEKGRGLKYIFLIYKGLKGLLGVDGTVSGPLVVLFVLLWCTRST